MGPQHKGVREWVRGWRQWLAWSFNVCLVAIHTERHNLQHSCWATQPLQP